MDRLLFARPAIIQPEIFLPFPHIRAGFSTRHGGVSLPPYESLNLGMSTGDVPERVTENRRRFLLQLGARPEQLAVAHQVHSARVHVVDAPGIHPEGDGLVTNVPDIVLGITVADCAAVLLADPEHRVIGACHAGWRGTVAGVVAATIDRMEALGAVRTDIRAYISPCISVDHFEVGPEVAAHFDDRYVHRKEGQARPHVDLKAALFDQLLAEGLLPTSIEVALQCTVAHNSLFYSYRAEKGTCGRMMGAIMLLPTYRR